MIRMICGSTRINDKLYSADDGPFSADEATEKRLVGLGVAEYVGGKSVATSGESVSGGETGVDIPAEETAAERPYEAVTDIPEYSIDSTIGELRTLAKSAGLTFKANTKKGDLVKMLDEYYGVGTLEDIGLDAEDIVV